MCHHNIFRWLSFYLPEYDALPVKEAAERGSRIMNYKEEIIRYRIERAEEIYQEALLMCRKLHAGFDKGTLRIKHRRPTIYLITH